MVRRTVQMARRMWLQSERDLATAKALLRPDTYYAAANFAHQAAEKSLKAAVWHVCAEEPPWTHNLVKCAKLIQDRIGILPPGMKAIVVSLDPVFVLSRYPSGDEEGPIPAEVIGELEAERAVRQAEEVQAWVLTLLQQPPGNAPKKARS